MTGRTRGEKPAGTALPDPERESRPENPNGNRDRSGDTGPSADRGAGGDAERKAAILSLRRALSKKTKTLIAALGGRETAARLTGRQLSTMSNWSGGASSIPLWAAALLCRQAGWPLERLLPPEFLHGDGGPPMPDQFHRPDHFHQPGHFQRRDAHGDRPQPGIMAEPPAPGFTAAPHPSQPHPSQPHPSQPRSPKPRPSQTDPGPHDREDALVFGGALSPDVVARVLAGLDAVLDGMGVHAIPPKAYRKLVRYMLTRVERHLAGGGEPATFDVAAFRAEIALAVGED